MKILRSFTALVIILLLAPQFNQASAGLNPDGTYMATFGNTETLFVSINNEGFKLIKGIEVTINTCNTCTTPFNLEAVTGDFTKDDFTKTSNKFILKDVEIEPQSSKHFNLEFSPNEEEGAQYSFELQAQPDDSAMGLSIQTSTSKIGGLFPEDFFSDLNEYTSYVDAIMWMNGDDIINGYPDGEFKPDQCVNRAEFLKIMFETKGQSTSPNLPNKFSDVSISEWYYPYVSTAAQLGIIRGYEDGSFKPSQCVNRFEAIKMAVEGMDVITSEFSDFSPDYSNIETSDWYFDYLSTASEKNLIGTLHVDAFKDFRGAYDMTRKEVVEMLYRIKAMQNNDEPMYSLGLIPTKNTSSRGTIEGSLTYPSEGFPDDLIACAKNLSTSHIYCTAERIYDDSYHYGAGYKLDVPVGNYHVYSELQESTDPDWKKFYYTEFMDCGISVDCKSHEKIIVKVEAAKNYFDAYIGDSYLPVVNEEVIYDVYPVDDLILDIDDDAMLGLSTAPITIIEFSDYECPFCKSFSQNTFPLIKEAYIDTGYVNYVYRDFPLTSIHHNALGAAQAAECARDQGGDSVYYEYHDLLFSSESLSEDLFNSYANDLDLDQEEFTQCMDSAKFLSEIQSDIDEGMAAGVMGTPTFFINGDRVDGAQPFEVFEETIEKWISAIGG